MDEVQKDKQRWKIWSQESKNKGAVTKNVVGVAISPRSP